MPPTETSLLLIVQEGTSLAGTERVKGQMTRLHGALHWGTGSLSFAIHASEGVALLIDILDLNGFLEGGVQDGRLLLQVVRAEDVGPRALRVRCLLQGTIGPRAEGTPGTTLGSNVTLTTEPRAFRNVNNTVAVLMDSNITAIAQDNQIGAGGLAAPTNLADEIVRKARVLQLALPLLERLCLNRISGINTDIRNTRWNQYFSQ